MNFDIINSINNEQSNKCRVNNHENSFVINPFELELLASNTCLGSLVKAPPNLLFVKLGFRLDPDTALVLDETR